MKRILVIQSRKAPERQRAEQDAYERAAEGAASFHFVSTLDVEQGWESPAELVRGFDAVIIGGSSDFFLHGGMCEDDDTRCGAREVLDRVRAVVEFLVERQVPTLGICFGHQLIAEVFGGAVSHDHAQKKAGTHAVSLTEAGENDPLMSVLGSSFEAQYAHRDSVTRPPLGSVTLAEGPSCRFAALRYGSAVYTFQFHPEIRAEDFLSRPDALLPYLSPGQIVRESVRPTPQAETLIRSFIWRP